MTRPSPQNVVDLNSGSRGHRPPRVARGFSPPLTTLPEAPEDLPYEAIVEWSAQGRLLIEAKRLTAVDLPALASYCRAHAQVVRAQKAINAEAKRAPTLGGLVVRERNAKTGVNVLRQAPWQKIQHDAMRICMMFLREFGMTPVSQSNVTGSTTHLSAGSASGGEGFDAL